jgi:outer membrane murein-binding lipoprotein Lpp
VIAPLLAAGTGAGTVIAGLAVAISAVTAYATIRTNRRSATMTYAQQLERRIEVLEKENTALRGEKQAWQDERLRLYQRLFDRTPGDPLNPPPTS